MTPIKIGFVLLSNSRNPHASTRIAALNMFPFLRAANFDPHIAFEPAVSTETPDVSGLAPRLLEQGFRIVLFQKVRGPSAVRLAQELKALGIKTIYCVCDLVDVPMVQATDAATAVTEYLKGLFPASLQPRIHVVHDGIEHPEYHKSEWSEHRGSSKRRLRAILVTVLALDHLPVIGKGPDWLEITIVGSYSARRLGLQRLRDVRWNLTTKRTSSERVAYLRFLADRRIKCHAWDPAGVYQEMLGADIGIIPIDRDPEEAPGMKPVWKLKSENRLTLMLSMGLPVIATPIPSYETVIVQGRNGFLADSKEDWLTHLEALREPSLRSAVGMQARESVARRFSKEAQASLLIAVLNRVLEERDQAA